MDFRRLEYFIAIAQLGSLTKAAEVLGLTEPSLSRQMRLLEDELSGPIFYRTGRGVRLTPAGDLLLEHASAIIEMTKRAQSAVVELNNGSSGRIAVGIPPRIARVLMVPLMEAFRRELPNASITVVEGLSVALSDWLALGRVEIALLFNQRSSPNLTIETLCSEELVLVGSNSRAALPKTVRFADIPKFPLILPAMPNTIRTSVESACRQAQIQPDIIIEVDTVQSILDLVKRGMGNTIVPRGSVPRDLVKSGYRVCRIQSPRLTHSVSLATSRGHPLTRLGMKTCDVIRELNLPKLLQS